MKANILVLFLLSFIVLVLAEANTEQNAKSCRITYKSSKDSYCKRKVCCQQGEKCKKTKFVCHKIHKTFCKWSRIRHGKCRKVFCCSLKKKRCFYKSKTICKKNKKAECKFRYYKVRKNQLCRKRVCCVGTRCRYVTKKKNVFTSTK